MEEKDKNTNTISELETNEKSKSAGEIEGLRERSEESAHELFAKNEEIKALQDKYLRLAAEFENYKRLAQRDQREFAKFANETLLKELLPIVDNLQRAIAFAKAGPGSEGLIQGVELTLKQFRETLAKFGVREIPSIGQAFDPSLHQAVSQVETSDAAANAIVDEHQKGYLLHDRVLRASMVTVAAPPAENADRAQSQEGQRSSQET
ncbi:MAG: nucleotide exchange factor GrpE [Nitrospiraceae bacterium]